MLKNIGATGALAFIPATAGAVSDTNASQEYQDRLNLNFNPNNKNQTGKFVVDSLKLDDNARETLQTAHDQQLAQQEYITQIQRRRGLLRSELTRNQFEAIAEVVAEIKLTPTTQPVLDSVEPQGEETVVGADSRQSQETPADEDEYSFFEGSTTVDPKVSVEACVPYLGCADYTREVAEWTHNVEWQGNKSWPPDVRNIDADLFGKGKEYAIANWVYKGISQGPDKRIYADGQYFRSEAEGKFSRNVLVNGGFTNAGNDYVFTEVAGSSNGSFNHIETRINGDVV